MIQNNIIHQSFLNGVKNLLFLGSSCIYPRLCPKPMKEEHLMTGPLEPTNSPYAIAKISSIEMCWSYNRQYNTNFIPIMPTIYMGRMIILILRRLMFFRHFFVNFMKQKKEMKDKLLFGEAERQNVNFFMYMIWRMLVFTL